MVTGYEVEMYRNISRIAASLEKLAKREPSGIEAFLREAESNNGKVRVVTVTNGQHFGYPVVDAAFPDVVRLYRKDLLVEEDDTPPTFVAIAHIVMAEYSD